MSDELKPVILPARRDVVRIGLAGALALGALEAAEPAWAAGPPNVVLTPEVEEVPFFVDERLNRSDVRVDPTDKSIQAGHPLNLTINVGQLINGKLTPLAGALVDIWHCNAYGAYSDVEQGGTVGRKFLRGYQVTSSTGQVNFKTIYPGWYNGRAVHIHAKIRVIAGNQTKYEFTTQMFFDDALSDKIYATQPYARHGQRDQTNETDRPYQEAVRALGKSVDIMTVKLSDDAAQASGKFNVALDMSQSHPSGGGRSRGRGPRGFGRGGERG